MPRSARATRTYLLVMQMTGSRSLPFSRCSRRILSPLSPPSPPHPHPLPSRSGRALYPSRIPGKFHYGDKSRAEEAGKGTGRIDLSFNERPLSRIVGVSRERRRGALRLFLRPLSTYQDGIQRFLFFFPIRTVKPTSCVVREVVAPLVFVLQKKKHVREFQFEVIKSLDMSTPDPEYLFRFPQFFTPFAKGGCSDLNLITV